MTSSTFAFDTETFATRPGLKAPPLVCLTHQSATGLEVVGGPQIVHGNDPAARVVFEDAIRDPEVMITGHFVAYDTVVCAARWPDLIPEIFAAYDANRVTCTMLREKLFDIATGQFRGFPDEKGVWRRHDYNLDAVARRRAGIPLHKDGWRKRYGEVFDLPLTAWPAYAADQKKIAIAMVEAGVKDADLEAIALGDPNEILRYPLEDARATLAVHIGQEHIRRKCDVDPFADEFRQARASFWLNLMTTWGLRTRAEGVELLRVQTEASLAELESQLVAAGLVRTDGSCDTKAAKARMLDVLGWRQIATKEGKKTTYSYEKARPDARQLRKTKGGDVCLDKDACAASDDELLTDYGERTQLAAVLNKDVPMLMAGTYLPVHTRIDIAGSGRITSSAPNVCNLRRLPGIREAFVPRDSWVFAQADFPGVELHTLGQSCIDLFGSSELARMLNDGFDPHLEVARRILRITYEEAKAAYKAGEGGHARYKEVDDCRQIGKVANFGFPGGLGIEKLCLFAKKTYKVMITPEEARELKKIWLEALPEMREYFAYIGRLTNNPEDAATILQLRSNRIRGGVPYTAACNTFFQGLAADATKHAGWLVAKACYVDRTSPLFGSRTVNYIYDELIVETRDNDNAHDAAHELARLMRDGANEFLPDCPFTELEPLLMRIWSKSAKPLPHPTTGRLVPWEPALVGMLGFGKAIAANSYARRAA